ncbi:MAG: NUDIX hydrolase [Candidatus Hydrogenedentes bacterium]|nr:NUDIX hydrolase [Candidatus Hydrogenedentota bacterium]
MEEWVDSKQVYAGKIVGLRVGEVRLDGGVLAFREVVEHPGGVGIVPVLDDSVLLVRQYRIAVGRDVLEIPAGKREGEEAIEHRARCELEEETGYRAGRLVPAGSIYASVGYCSEEIFLFLAFDLKKVGQNLEFDEQIELVRIPLVEIPQRLAAGEFKDSKTIIALHALLAHLNC